MLKKIQESIEQDLLSNKLNVFYTFFANTVAMMVVPRGGTTYEIIFWLCVIFEVLIVFYISAMVYYSFRKNEGKKV
jgi:uncharacterized membrane protein YdbT with pleckstrin-like domain